MDVSDRPRLSTGWWWCGKNDINFMSCSEGIFSTHTRPYITHVSGRPETYVFVCERQTLRRRLRAAITSECLMEKFLFWPPVVRVLSKFWRAHSPSNGLLSHLLAIVRSASNHSHRHTSQRRNGPNIHRSIRYAVCYMYSTSSSRRVYCAAVFALHKRAPR